MGRDELAQRAHDFSRGRWADLIFATTQLGGRRGFPKDVRDEQWRRGLAVQSRVDKGQVSRAGHELTGAVLAPQNNETLGELRRRRAQERESPSLTRCGISFSAPSDLGFEQVCEVPSDSAHWEFSWAGRLHQ